MYIDTHTHLSDARFDNDRDQLILSLIDLSVDFIIEIGYGIESSKKAKQLAEKFDNVYYAVGVHPSEANSFDDKAALKIEKLASHEKCVAIGEIGLDYHYEGFNKQKQRDCFLSQIDIAEKLKLPFIVHSRDASKDVIDIISSKKNKLTNGFLMHCYSESAEQAKNYLKLGAYFAFGGALTFKNSGKSEIVKTIPLDRIMAETDCPYLSPEPKRGRRNEPQNVRYVYARLAEILEADYEKLCCQIKNNVFSLFKKLKGKL